MSAFPPPPLFPLTHAHTHRHAYASVVLPCSSSLTYKGVIAVSQTAVALKSAAASRGPRPPARWRVSSAHPDSHQHLPRFAAPLQGTGLNKTKLFFNKCSYNLNCVTYLFCFFSFCFPPWQIFLSASPKWKPQHGSTVTTTLPRCCRATPPATTFWGPTCASSSTLCSSSVSVATGWSWSSSTGKPCEKSSLD